MTFQARLLPLGRPLILAAVFTLAVAGCEKQVALMEPLAFDTISDLTAGEPVAFDLSSYEADLLLVRISGFETALSSSVAGETGEFQSRVQIPHLRSVPLFHVIEQESEKPPSRVVLKAKNLTHDAKIDVATFELPNTSARDLVRIEAFRDFEAATQSTNDESPSLWRSRIELLEKAAAGFKHAGDNEPQLWAEFLNAYIHYFPLAEYEQAARMSRDIQRQARKYDFRNIELMAAQLEGQALIERDQRDTLDAAQEKAGLGQAVLERAVELAAEMGYQYEQAYALNSRGIGYFYQGRHDQAEAFYAQALAMALELQDASLEIQVRGNLALVHERQGELYGALAELQAVNEQLRAAGVTADLAHNWSELSRLNERLYLFPESIQAQGHALDIWHKLNSAEGKGRSGLSLAHSYQAIGNSQRALAVLIPAISELQTAGFTRGLRDSYGLLAQLYRGLGRFEQMAAARDLQRGYLSSGAQEARFRYETGLDALTRFPDKPSQAMKLFQEAEVVARDANDAGLELRARLQYCAITSMALENCAPTVLSAAVETMLHTATPSQAIEASFLWAQILVRAGHSDDAWRVMNSLVDDIRFYRHTLPGVLGAWYWEGRARIFDLYMHLALDVSSNAAQSLLAFNRLLNISLNVSVERNPAGRAPSAEINELRGLLAQLDRDDSQSAQDVPQSIDRSLLQLKDESEGAKRDLDAHNLRDLLAGLPPQAGLLAYYLASDDARAWLVTKHGVQVFSLGRGDQISQVLEAARTGLRVVGNKRLDKDLQQLGELLLAPLGPDLPETLYVLSVGPLAGVPFEAIRTNNGYLGQQHVVINMLSLEALGQIDGADRGLVTWQEFLVAGDPYQAGTGYSALPSASAELDGLAELLAGQSVTLSKGVQLNSGLFQSREFGTADVIHIASHARINLEYPELSRLLVSSENGEEVYLTPLDLQGTTIAADLVVLSACETSGVNTFSFDTNLGFVSALLQSGADAVMATLWPVADAFAAQFVLDLYSVMLDGASPAEALALVKRRHITKATAGDITHWPAFQIYIN